MNARYYDPAIGAFVSPDTLVPDASLVSDYNRYAYSRGNPLGYSDPNGHEPCPTGAWGDCSPTPSRSFVNNLATSRHQAGSDWEDLSAEMQTMLASDGLHEGVYRDLGGNTTAQTGWRDLATLAATLYGGVRLVWRLPGLLMGACADGDCINEVNSVQQATAKGSLQILGDTANYRTSELNAARYMANLGNEVILRQPTQGSVGRVSDLLVNGVTYDVYTPVTTNANRIISAIASKGSQADGIVLDLTQTTVTLQDLGNILARVQGAGAKNITDIVIIGGQ